MGEEFIIILPNTDAAQALTGLERLREAGLGTRPNLAPVTASIGLVERVAEGTWRVPADLPERARQHDAQRLAGGSMTLHSHLPIERQARVIGATWLDRQLISGGDGISDNGEEIYSFFRQRKVRNVVLMGVHTNMCVLGRPFGIRQQVRLGMNVALARDLVAAHREPVAGRHVDPADPQGCGVHISVVDDRGEGLRGVYLKVKDKAAITANAAKAGVPHGEDYVDLVGVRFMLV